MHLAVEWTSYLFSEKEIIPDIENVKLTMGKFGIDPSVMSLKFYFPFEIFICKLKTSPDRLTETLINWLKS